MQWALVVSQVAKATCSPGTYVLGKQVGFEFQRIIHKLGVTKYKAFEKTWY